MDATDLVYAGAAEQSRLMTAGEVSSREVVEATLARAHDLQPILNAYRVIRPEQALAAADAADARRARGEDGPLLGVPVAIKDDVDMAGEATAWGTAAHGGPKTADAEVIARLRAGGAVPIGKTNVPEMTIWPFTETLTFGVTRNPWDLDRTTGGSSGGTAAAVAAGLCGVGLGSDGAGSIRIPAAWCGVFGLKPTRDLVPIAPHDDAWQGLSVNGPLARHVADAALFLDATAAQAAPEGGWASAAATAPGPLRIALSVKPPPGALTRVDPDRLDAVHATADLLRSLGHEIVEREPRLPATAWSSSVTRYLTGIATDVATMPHPERLEPRTRAMARLGRAAMPALRWARSAQAAVAAAFDDVLRDCDAILSPGTAQPPFRIGQLHGRGALWTLNASAYRVPFQALWNAIGYPAISVPSGYDAHGLPIGVQIGAGSGRDAALLGLAAQLERARPWADRRPPL